MSVVISRALALTILMAFQAPNVATAQPGDERARSLQLAARNQLGLLEYCRAQGMVDEKVVSTQREMVQRLSGSPASNPVDSPEEASGRAGFLAFGERQGRFDESAAAQGLTLKTACEGRAAIATATTSQ